MQVESVRENNATMYVNVRSLHQDEQHRWGEIRMSCNQGEVSIRSIAIEHQKREGLTISLSAAELGDPTAGGFQQCSELAKYLTRRRPVAQPCAPPIPPAAICRRQREIPQVLRKAHFKLDMTALYPSDQKWGTDNNITVTLRGGQATRHDAAAALPLASRKRTLKTAGTQKKILFDHMPIEAPRWALLQRWTKPDLILDKWQLEWKRTTAWEEQGGRTLSWAITSAICEQLRVEQAVGAFDLTIDPSFGRRAPSATPPPPRPKRSYIALYEMTVQEAEETLQARTRAGEEWVAIVSDSQATRRQRAILRRHAVRIHEYSKGDSICLRKGWWMTGERKLTKAISSFSIWRSTVGEWDEFLPPTTEHSLCWMPTQVRQSVNLECYMAALPGASYRNNQHQVAATDGSLRLHRSGDNEPTMGAGVAWEQTNTNTISVKIGGPFSSTRPELAAIALALQQASATKTLVLLVDSAAALQRLRWLRSDDFRPLQHKMRDLDIINDILDHLQTRQEKGLDTILVKVFGHSGDPVHERADTAAVHGAELQVEDDKQLHYPCARNPGMLFKWTDEKGKVRVEPWNTRIARHVRSFESECRWQRRKTGTYVETFLSRKGAARDMLGKALRHVGDWALRGWILSLTPYRYPVKASFKKWNKTPTALCECGYGDETMLHLQLSCSMPHRKKTRQTAHNNVALAIERHVKRMAPKHWVDVWDKATTTFLTTIAETPEQAYFLNELAPEDLRDWDKLVRKHRATFKSNRSPPALGRKRGMRDIEKMLPRDTQQVRPDGLIFDSQQRRIHLLEVARTSDEEQDLRNRFIGKIVKYRNLTLALKECFPMYTVLQHTFVIGIQGSVDEAIWRRQLEQIGLSEVQQSRVIQDCITASIEGMHLVLRASPTPANSSSPTALDPSNGGKRQKAK